MKKIEGYRNSPSLTSIGNKSIIFLNITTICRSVYVLPLLYPLPCSPSSFSFIPCCDYYIPIIMPESDYRDKMEMTGIAGSISPLMVHEQGISQPGVINEG
jgi:hypothetical protein